MKKLMFFIIGAILLIYFVMFFSTNSIVNDVRNIMCGNIDESLTKNTPLRIYNFSDILFNAEVEVSITRLFVLHNFFDGYMWVKYTYKTVKNDNDIKPCSTNVLSRWKIHKENGSWKVTEIVELP